MAKYYAPNFSGLLPLFDGKSVAGGKLYAYRAGTSIPAPLFNQDGVELGSWVSIDSNGCADILIDSALSYKLVVKDALGATVGEWDNVQATNAPGGMDNPMQNPGDLIVGGTGGTATALPVGSEGQVLKVVSGAPAWGTDTAGMSNPMTTEGDLIVGTTDGAPTRLGVGVAGQVLTSDGTTWTPANIPTQTGDHKTQVDGSDTSPDYLAAKLAAGSGISLTNTGSAVSIAADTQSGDHHVLVTNADAAAGTLADKLVAGSNVTLTPVTDGDGVQTLEISATGGGGGGGAKGILLPWGPMVPSWFIAEGITSGKTFCIFGRTALRNCTIKKVLIGTFAADTTPSVNELGVYAMRSNRALTLLGKTSTYTLTVDGSMIFEFTTPLSVGDEIIFLGHLCGATYQTTKVAYIRSVYSGQISGATLPSTLNTTYAIDSNNCGSRLGFVWSDRTLQSLPASTTSSDWNYNYNYLPLPYTEVFYE